MAIRPSLGAESISERVWIGSSAGEPAQPRSGRLRAPGRPRLGRGRLAPAAGTAPALLPVGLIDAAVAEAAFEGVEVVGELALDPFQIGQARTVGELVEHPCGDQFGDVLDLRGFFAERTHGDLPWEQEAETRMWSARPPCGNGSVRGADGADSGARQHTRPATGGGKHALGFLFMKLGELSKNEHACWFRAIQPEKG